MHEPDVVLKVVNMLANNLCWVRLGGEGEWTDMRGMMKDFIARNRGMLEEIGISVDLLFEKLAISAP